MKQFLILGIALATFHNIYSEIPDHCVLAKDEGAGANISFHFYYEQAEDLCYPFMYKGEGGNLNRFPKERDCIRQCSLNAEAKYPVNEASACHLKKAAGGCQGNFLRYYYDSVHDKCKKFLWTGCFGNGNRFFDQLSCNATCAGIHDDGDEPEEDEPDTNVGMIAGILLGIIGAVIIALVVVLTVKSRKEQKEPKKSKEPEATSLQDGDKGTELEAI